MKVVKVTKKEKNQVELSISVSAEEFEKACERSYHMNASKINIPGFRKGKAPRKMIEKIYGEGVFYEDAMNICCDETYYEAVKEKGLEPVDRPAVTDLDVNDKKEFSYKAIVTVKPEGKLSAYKGLKAEKAVVKVSEKEVNEEIERVRERNARQVVVERAVKEGDIITFDFDGYVDGKQFDGGKAENYDLKIGSGMFIPGFEDQLIGKKAGEACDVKVTFPKDYQAKELAGKEAVFKCLVKEVKESVKPELDDEFAKDVSEFDTLADYKADIKKHIHDSKEARANADFEEKLLDKLIEGFECDIPEVMFDRQTDRLVEDFSYRITSQGMDMDSYLKMSGMDMQSLRKIFSVQAERNVKVRLALETVAKEEKLTVSDKDVDAEIAKIAESSKMTPEQIKQYISVEDMKNDILVERALTLVRDTAKATAPQKASDEKKTSAKATGDKKPAVEKTQEKKPAEKKTAEKKTAEKKTADKKPASKKTETAKKSTAKTSAAKSVKADTAEKKEVKKETAKKTTASKTASAAKKTSSKKTSK